MTNDSELPSGNPSRAQSAVPAAVTTWAVEILQSPGAQPRFATATRVFWHRRSALGSQNASRAQRLIING